MAERFARPADRVPLDSVPCGQALQRTGYLPGCAAPHGLENVSRGKSNAPPPDTQVLMNVFILCGLLAHAEPRAWVSLQERHRDVFMRLKFRMRLWHAAAVCPRSPQSSHVAAAS